MRLSGASLPQSLPGNDFKTVASAAQHGFVESRNNSSWQGPAKPDKAQERQVEGLNVRVDGGDLAIGLCDSGLQGNESTERKHKSSMVMVRVGRVLCRCVK
jgi:hypothetical protein